MGIIPIILGGGSGSRLWPLSCEARPKQFLNLIGENSLLQNTVLRCDHPIFDPTPIILCALEHRFIAEAEMRAIDKRCQYILEPVQKDTCAAIAAGCLAAKKQGQSDQVLIMASDHYIPDRDAFCAAVADAASYSRFGKIITFGVAPKQPSTKYGYILPQSKIGETNLFKIKHFSEKPDKAEAQILIEDGGLWNSGNFLADPDVFLSELEAHVPDILCHVTQAMANSKAQDNSIYLEELSYDKNPSISIDHAVMEKTIGGAVYPVDYEWSDLGTWDSVWPLFENRNLENSTHGNVEIRSGSNNLVFSPDKPTSVSGVDNTLIVATKDAVLVAAKDAPDQLEHLVDNFQQLGCQEGAASFHTLKPWGNYEVIDRGNKYQVKRLTVNPGCALSLQRHEYRSEHWVVVAGLAKIYLDARETNLEPGQSIFVPQGATHRLTNPGEIPLILVEVQRGSYLGEDDIERLNDHYNRM